MVACFGLLSTLQLSNQKSRLVCFNHLQTPKTSSFFLERNLCYWPWKQSPTVLVFLCLNCFQSRGFTYDITLFKEVWWVFVLNVSGCQGLGTHKQIYFLFNETSVFLSDVIYFRRILKPWYRLKNKHHSIFTNEQNPYLTCTPLITLTTHK